MQTPPHVAIIGGGFSGSALAMHLLVSLHPPARLTLIEPADRLGRGLAYATRSPSHWLNVPCGRLGWHPDDEGGFLAWLQERRVGARGGDFLPRSLLGDYLAEQLGEAIAAGQRRGLDWQWLREEALDVTALPADTSRIRLKDGSTLDADIVVLATGHLPARAPALPGVQWGEAGLIDHPWAEGALDDIPEDGAVLILGQGLTAVDMLTHLHDRGHAGSIHLLSRRGLMSQPHRTLEARPRLGLSPVLELGDQTGLPAILRAVRRWAREAEAEGRDWRDVMASLRSCTPDLWRRLSEADRRRFLRHLQPYWDTHRHRIAPGIHRRVGAALRTGELLSHRGRLTHIERLDQARPPTPSPNPSHNLLRVTWQPRGEAASRVLDVAAVINCTGASTSLRHAPSPLLNALRNGGRLRADALDLGLEVDEQHRPLGADGQPQPGLFYLGPMLKAQHWEAIAVPELRVHAREVAQQVLAELGRRRRHGGV